METVYNLDITTIVVTAITMLGSVGGWNYYTKRLELKRAREDKNIDNNNLYRDDLRERVAVLEERLERERKHSDDLQDEISDLKSKMMEYIVRLEYLEKENLRLRAKAGEV